MYRCFDPKIMKKDHKIVWLLGHATRNSVTRVKSCSALRHLIWKKKDPSLINSDPACMAEWLRRLISLSPLIIRSSHRCGWCGFEPHWGHMWDKSSSTCGCVRWFFPGELPFSPHLLIDLSRYEWNTLENDVRMNKRIDLFGLINILNIAPIHVYTRVRRISFIFKGRFASEFLHAIQDQILCDFQPCFGR